MEGRRVHGHDQVRAYWTRQWSLVHPRVEPVNITEEESGRQVVLVHQVVRDLAATVLLDQMVEHVYSFQNGLIDRMDIRAVDDNSD